MSALTRRQVLCAGLAGAIGCSRRDPPSPSAPVGARAASSPLTPRSAPDARLGADAATADARVASAPAAPEPPPPHETLDGGSSPVALEIDVWNLPPPIERALLVRPRAVPRGTRLPIVVALHGRGEARKGPERGAEGWPRDYALLRAYERLSAPPLTAADYEGLVDAATLAATNRALRERPFRPLAVLCPYLPDIDLDSPSDQDDYARVLVDVLLPRARREPELQVEPATTGIDGVSLGGAVALRAGLGHPEAFGAVGALQPAIRTSQVDVWVALAKAARDKRPTQKLRLTTSHQDYFLEPTHRLSEALRAAGLAHDFAELPGPHDYVFNRGPGAITLLDWQDRALRAD